MPDAFAEALAQPGLGLLVFGAFLAGVVRGFSGFGTALIYLPIAAQVLTPVGALVTMSVMDMFGPLPNLPRAWRTGQPRDVGLMLAGAIVALPFGVALLLAVPAEVFRYGVALLSLGLLICLALGLRYRGRLTRTLVLGIGTSSGFLGGASGIAGPPVILFYMASKLPVAAIRANIMVYLFAVNLLILAMLGLRGQVAGPFVVTGLMLAVPVILGNVAGAAIFRPAAERFYRAAAYGIIAASALSGLPLWD